MAWEKDLLERQSVASFLQKLLESDQGIKVVNIDSAWGTGKTFFLENWRDELKAHRGVVYFNAWERDYTGDPFISLVSAIKFQLEAQTGKGDKLRRRFDEFSEQASSAIVSAGPVILKEIVRGLTKKLTGIDADKFACAFDDEGKDDGSAAENLCESAMGVADKASAQVVKSLIENNEKNVESVESFRKVFEGLVEEVGIELSENDAPKPVYVFVDELDRCRPTYAIELLERVKHFLDVSGCKFVIATDTKQLCHSVKAVYGSGFNSFGYLKRFFDITYTLDNSDLRSWVKKKVVFDFGKNLNCLNVRVKSADPESSWRFHGEPAPVRPDKNTIVSEDIELDDVQVVIIALCKTFLVSLRELDKLIIHLKAALLSFAGDVEFILLAYLVFLRSADPDLYRSFLEDDTVETRRKLKIAYPPFKLYMIYECVDVHEVAADYIRVGTMDRDQLIQELNGSGDSYSYARDIRFKACNGEQYRKYVNSVELAGQLS